jgi:phosphonate transport system substrate-binding protein
VAVAVLLVNASTSAGEERPLEFGVFPYLPPAQLEKLYAPVAADLSVAVGRRVHLRTRPSFDLFRSEILQERYDLIFIQPFAYANVASRHGYRSVARPSTALKAVFVIRSDSDIQGFADLKGETLSAPPQQAAVSLLAKETLRKHNLMPGIHIRVTYQNSHHACLRAVLIRKAAACITAPPPLQIFEAQTGVRFRILGYSDPVPGSTYAVHQRLPEALREAIAERVVSWDQTSHGQALLKSLKFPGFIRSDNDDYHPVRDILRSLQGNEGQTKND